MNNEFWNENEEDAELSAEEVAHQENDEETDAYQLNEERVADAMAESGYEQFQDEDLENDSELITNARLRLEQGKLYEMLLKHDLFGSVDADPKAIANVQREIRNFIKDRLEILLGLKPDPRLSPVQAPQAGTKVESPFSTLEVDLLKRFLSKMSKGATEQVSQPAQEQAPTPVSKPRSESIRPLSSGPIAPKPSAVRVSPNKPSVRTEPSSQIKAPKDLKKILEEEFGENEMPLGKPASKLKRSEIIERNRRIAQRQASRKAVGPNHIPAPNGEQEAMIMMQHVVSRNESLQTAGGGATNMLKLAIAKSIQDKAE
jgi:hypothetical protein